MTHWLLFLPLLLEPQDGSDPARRAREAVSEGKEGIERLAKELAERGLRVDPALRRVSFGALAHDAQMPIEYLLVGPRGAVHETLFLTEAKPSDLTTALYLLGLEPGRNVQYRDRTPPPTEAEMAEGALPYEVIPPEGPGVFVYAEWKEGEEAKRFRAEDLLLNTRTRRTAARVRWVFLGSRWLRPTPKDPPVFAADLEENLVSVCYFGSGNQVLANPDLDGQEQHIFLPNSWLLPAKGTPVTLVFSRERLEDAGGASR